MVDEAELAASWLTDRITTYLALVEGLCAMRMLAEHGAPFAPLEPEMEALYADFRERLWDLLSVAECDELEGEEGLIAELMARWAEGPPSSRFPAFLGAHVDEALKEEIAEMRRQTEDAEIENAGLRLEVESLEFELKNRREEIVELKAAYDALRRQQRGS